MYRLKRKLIPTYSAAMVYYPFVANPDLPSRILNGQLLAPHDPNTLFCGGEKGLTD